MKCIWSPMAKREMRKVTDYIIENFGASYALDFITKVEMWDAWIAENPGIARVEPLLKCRTKHTYRSVIIKPYTKVILYTVGESVRIADLWDMRRHPDRLIARIKE